MLGKSNSEWIWAAGLFDGEGSIFTAHRTARPKFVGINIALSMTDIEPVQRFSDVTGLPLKEVQRLTKSGKKVYRCATQAHDTVLAIWENLRPNLSAAKRRQGDNAIDERLYYLKHVKPNQYRRAQNG